MSTFDDFMIVQAVEKNQELYKLRAENRELRVQLEVAQQLPKVMELEIRHLRNKCKETCHNFCAEYDAQADYLESLVGAALSAGPQERQ